MGSFGPDGACAPTRHGRLADLAEKRAESYGGLMRHLGGLARPWDLRPYCSLNICDICTCAGCEHLLQPEPDRHGDGLQDGAGAVIQITGPHQRPGKSVYRTPDGPTPKGRRSAGGTAWRRSGTSCGSILITPELPQPDRTGMPSSVPEPARAVGISSLTC